MALRIHHSDDELTEAHEINVTPFIDVMLVLLIIFMVAAPLMTTDVHVDLPGSTAQHQSRPDKPIFLTIKADHGLFLGETPVTKEGLQTALDRLTRGDKAQRVYLRADKTVDYDTLMQAMNTLRAGGYLKVALVGLDQPSP